jgi:solute carrier family 25 (mitochondrial phosphate transporter), member 23/24/25/41
MASEDVVGKSTGETAVSRFVNLADESKASHAVFTVCKSLFAGGVAGAV